MCTMEENEGDDGRSPFQVLAVVRLEAVAGQRSVWQGNRQGGRSMQPAIAARLVTRSFPRCV